MGCAELVEEWILKTVL